MGGVTLQHLTEDTALVTDGLWLSELDPTIVFKELVTP